MYVCVCMCLSKKIWLGQWCCGMRKAQRQMRQNASQSKSEFSPKLTSNIKFCSPRVTDDSTILLCNGTLRHQDAGTLGHWNTRTLGHLDTGTPWHWDIGTLEHRNTGTLGHWDTGTLGQQKTRINWWVWGAHLPQPQPCNFFWSWTELSNFVLLALHHLLYSKWPFWSQGFNAETQLNHK